MSQLLLVADHIKVVGYHPLSVTLLDEVGEICGVELNILILMMINVINMTPHNGILFFQFALLKG